MKEKERERGFYFLSLRVCLFGWRGRWEDGENEGEGEYFCLVGRNGGGRERGGGGANPPGPTKLHPSISGRMQLLPPIFSTKSLFYPLI